MSDKRLHQLIDAWRDDELTDGQTSELNSLLRESEEARMTFAAESRMHSLLHSAVAASAVERIAAVAETPLSPHHGDDAASYPSTRTSRTTSRFLLLIASTTICLLIVLLIDRQRIPARSAPQVDPTLKLAEIRYARAANFTTSDSAGQAGIRPLEVGTRLAPGIHSLNSGFVELDFFGGTVVAVESPAILELISQREARLVSGRVTIDAGDAATSFVLHTPVGEVLDIGTRYGVYVAGDGETETHVFEGEVDIRQTTSRQSPRRVEADSAVRITTTGVAESLPVSESAFPQASRQIVGLLRYGDFEPVTNLQVGRADFGQWGGDICQVVGERQGIRPFSGEGMLLFQSTGQNPRDDRASPTAASQLSQWIDLTPYRAAIANGQVKARLSARFNRVTGDEKTDSQFNIHLESFDVPPEEAVQLRTSQPRMPRSRVSYDLLSDSDPESWEKVDAVLGLPPNALYLEATIFAFENVSNDQDASSEFDGHFADDLQFELFIEPTGSEASSVR